MNKLLSISRSIDIDLLDSFFGNRGLSLTYAGKTDYRTLTDMVLAEDENGSGWIAKLTELIK